MKKILIANRGEIAVRIIRTCREMGIATVAVCSEADLGSAHADFADEVHLIGPAPSAESYLRGDKIIEVAHATGAEAIHPGFGFLSENADFAQQVRDAGLIFIGPEADVIRLMGSKQASKNHVSQAGVPVVPGYNGEDQSPDVLAAEAEKIGYPLLIKASAGGGGKGMRIVRQGSAFMDELGAAKREAKSAFGDDTVLLEKYLERPRHVELQVFGDKHGQVVHLFERECSIQRRHQKIVEESPSPALDEALRARMAEAAVAAAKSVNYTTAGTVEFMLAEDNSFYFLEMNTRLQVEHPVTEMITGLDLVRWQIMVARGEKLPIPEGGIRARGAAIEVRVYAEDPHKNFFPQTGKLLRYIEPEGMNIRVDSGVRQGDEISIYYDPMIAKLIAFGADREEARHRLRYALSEYAVHGVRNNLGFLRQILGHQAFIDGDTTTDFLDRHFPDTTVEEKQLQAALALSVMGRSASSGRQRASQQVGALHDPWEQLTDWRGYSA